MKGYSLKVEEFEWVWCNGVITHETSGQSRRYTKSTQIPQLLENSLSFVSVMISLPLEIIHLTTSLGNLTLECHYRV